MSKMPVVAVSDTTLDRLETPMLVVVMARDALDLTGELSAVNDATNGALGRAIERRDFRGGRDETLLLGGGATGVQRVLVIGVGPIAADITAADRAVKIRRAATLAGRQANKLGV